MVWSDVYADDRVLLNDDPDEALAKFENLVKTGHGGAGKTRITGNNKGWFKNVFSAPIVLKAGAKKVLRYAFVACGDSEAEVINTATFAQYKMERGGEHLSRSAIPYQL